VTFLPRLNAAEQNTVLRHAASALLLISQVVVPHPAHSGNCDKSGAVQVQVITTLTKINMIIPGPFSKGGGHSAFCGTGSVRCRLEVSSADSNALCFLFRYLNIIIK